MFGTQCHMPFWSVASFLREHEQLVQYNLCKGQSRAEWKFTDNPPHCIGLPHLLPKQCFTTELGENIPEELANTADFYREDLPHPVMLPTEYRMWVRRWMQHGWDGANKLVAVFQSCDSMAFPNIRVLLHLASIQITSCESERIFSQLKLLKSSHRSTVSVIRHSGLNLMKINRTECDCLQQSPAEMEKLVALFHQLYPKRLVLPFILSD